MSAVRDIPLLVIVDGPPASGKTTIATSLGDRLGLPVLSKDVIKEALFDILGTGDRAWSRKVGIASIEVMLRLAQQELGSGRGIILESTFDPRFETAPLQAIISGNPVIVVQVYCWAAVEVLVQRSLDRAATGERHVGHVDQSDADGLRTAIASNRWPPLDLDGASIRLDTTSFADVQLDSLASDIRRMKVEAVESSKCADPSDPRAPERG
jgi:predicted kinase